MIMIIIIHVNITIILYFLHLSANQPIILFIIVCWHDHDYPPINLTIIPLLIYVYFTHLLPSYLTFSDKTTQLFYNLVLSSFCFLNNQLNPLSSICHEKLLWKDLEHFSQVLFCFPTFCSYDETYPPFQLTLRRISANYPPLALHHLSTTTWHFNLLLYVQSIFFATLVALHRTPVSQSIIRSFELA